MAGLSRGSVQTLIRRIVKPCSPTPPPQRCYKLSRVDQSCASHYIPISFFFPSIDNGRFTRNDQLFSNLKRSLAKVLSYYYPLAGRIVGNDHVNCNDTGVELIQARINCSLAEILRNINSPDVEDLVLPEGLPWKLADDISSPLVAQVTHFDSQGLALSLCMSHKFSDGFGWISFINDWAAIAQQTNHVPSPALMGASVFPPGVKVVPGVGIPLSTDPVTRRFIFRAAEIEKLKAKAIRLGVEQPTRVEVVTALLFRSAIVASSVGAVSFRPSLLAQVLNLRSAVVPPVPPSSFGNYASTHYVYGTNKNNITFEQIVAQLRKVTAERRIVYEQVSKGSQSDGRIQEVCRQYAGEHGGHSLECFYPSSVCQFPFYSVDFGWGRPTRVGIFCSPFKNHFMLMDTPDGRGIEAMVTRDRADMENFERNDELLSFVATASTK